MLHDGRMFGREVGQTAAMLIMAILTCGVVSSNSSAQTAVPAPQTASTVDAPTRHLPNRMSQHALAFYSAIWGIDAITVKAVESGELIRFSYQVLDPDKAKALNEKTNNAYLIAHAAGIRLSVPSLEKVGQLRQSSTPEAGKFYWMAFSNPGRRVKPGDRVDVMIGPFRVEGLTVQ